MVDVGINTAERPFNEGLWFIITKQEVIQSPCCLLSLHPLPPLVLPSPLPLPLPLPLLPMVLRVVAQHPCG